MSQAKHVSPLWNEPAGNGGTPTVAGAYLVKGGPGFIIETSTTPEGALIDWDNSGVYDLVDLTERLVLTDGGPGVLTLAASGTAAAIITADADGDPLVTDDLTQREVFAFCLIQSGMYVLTRLDGTDGLKMIAIGSTIQLHE